MPELSNLLRHRLVAQQKQEVAAQVHPDADTLTAFSEQLLPAAERQQVITHLAACAECREVVALSQPELAIPETQPVLTPAAAPLWRSLFKPAFGLGAAVAAMAIVAVLVLQHPHATNQPAQSNQEAKVMPAPAPAANGQNSLPQAPAGNTSNAFPLQDGRSFAGGQAGLPARNEARAERSTPTPRVAAGTARPLGPIIPAKTSAAAPLQPSLTAGLQKQDYLNNAFFETSADTVALNANGLPAAPAAHNLSSEAKLSAAAGQVPSAYDIPANSGKSNVRLLTPSPADHSSIFDKLKIAGARNIFRPRIAPAIKSNSLGFSAMNTKPGMDMQKDQPAEMASAPANAGIGGTETALASRALSASSFASGGASAPLWKIAGGKLFRSTGSAWEEAYPGASFQFTVVTPHGSEVWAGGSQATLIHSRDGGAHWETAKLGDLASGAIMSIVFLGSNVQVKTSDNQSWSSSDGGKTWTQESN